jgi:ribosomal protein L40E
MSREPSIAPVEASTSLPICEAAVCVQCEAVFPSAARRCPSCRGEAWLMLRALLDASGLLDIARPPATAARL